jgi:N-methylhydantoinase A
MRIGIDIGGTFTDIVCIEEDGTLTTRKVSSSVDDYSRSIGEALPGIFAQRQLQGSAVVEVLHGTTIATNAILEQRGAKTGLITTKGFRDVLELRRMRMPELYNWNWDKPPDLVERRLRCEVEERLDARGDVVTPLNLEAARGVIEKLLAEQVESIAICLINSYANPAHEDKIAQLVHELRPEIPVSISSDILREVREYERTATVVVNAYVLPLVRHYIQSLERALEKAGVQAPLLIMQSNGGAMTAADCARKPVFIIESGPAAGVIAAHGLALRNDIDNAITFDMGGTTTKASIIEAGELSKASEYEVGSSLSLVSRLIKGGGHLIRIPAIDVAEIGAGGGSIAWLDEGKALHVGPKSAGSTPGPVCYDQGGTKTTITDANLLLGYINDQGLVGGGLKLDYAKAKEALQRQIADPLEIDVYDAAYGVHLMANSSIMRALRAVSTERGRDARDFALIGFGGSGPMHSCGIVRALEMKEAIIPPNAGLFSAFGLLFADVEHHLVHTFYDRTQEADLNKLNELLRQMEEHAAELLAKQGYARSEIQMERSSDIRYAGQSYELTIPVPAGVLTHDSVTTLEQAFDKEHEKTYGHHAGAREEYIFVNFRVIGRIRRTSVFPKALRNGTSQTRRRRAYFGSKSGWHDTPVISRWDLSAKASKGPFLIDEYDTTTVVPPDCLASLDGNGNIYIKLGGQK